METTLEQKTAGVNPIRSLMDTLKNNGIDAERKFPLYLNDGSVTEEFHVKNEDGLARLNELFPLGLESEVCGDYVISRSVEPLSGRYIAFVSEQPQNKPEIYAAILNEKVDKLKELSAHTGFPIKVIEFARTAIAAARGKIEKLGVASNAVSNAILAYGLWKAGEIAEYGRARQAVVESIGLINDRVFGG